MIPLKLQIKNFLSYGPTLQSIDFGPYPLICLNGKNGHGKSALLDAITWAVWGQARKISGVAKADAHLLRLGQTNMMVIFDFVFNNNTYRVKREFTLSKSGNHQTVLEFGILDAQSDKLQPLTDKTIRGTQQTIEQLIGLDFDSFINSAFLRQGQSNEFSKKSPKERKDILAAILQLDKYEQLRKAAQEHYKHINDDIVRTKTTQERLEKEFAKIGQLETESSALESNLFVLKATYDAESDKLNTIKQQKNNLLLDQQKHDLSLTQLAEKVAQKKKLEGEVHTLFTQWRHTNATLLRTINPQELATKKQLLTQQLAQSMHMQQEQLKLKEAHLLTQTKENNTLHTLKEESLAVLKKQEFVVERLRLEVLRQTEKIKDATEQKDTLVKQYAVLEKQTNELTIKSETAPALKDIKKFEQVFEKKKTYYHRWVTRLQLLQKERAHTLQKQELASDAENPSCSLCEQNLSASRKRFLHNKFARLLQDIHHKQTRLTKILPTLKTILLDEHKTITTLRNQQQEQVIYTTKLQELSNNTAQLHQQLQQLEQTIFAQQQQLGITQKNNAAEIVTLQNMQKNCTELIEQNQELQAIRAEKAALQNKLNNCSYNAQTQQLLITKLEQLQKEEELLTRSEEAKKLQAVRRQTIHTHCAQLKQSKSIASDYTHIKAQQQEIAAKITSLTAQEENVGADIANLQKKKDELFTQQGRLKQELERAKTLLSEYQELQKKLTDLQETMHDYQTLATAFSKDGIQALLIEDAIPEIEQEANNLLSKLTNNQAHIIIESLRDLKKGGSKETLDINVSDPMGIRPYELFSGGEAFRIDFALRIAISKLLARRAGTSLQTLIIDEGFGSQDEEGINLLTDALYKIQDDFAKVIVVSHLPSMKDQFPVHFVIQKTPSGSKVHIVEQG